MGKGWSWSWYNLLHSNVWHSDILLDIEMQVEEAPEQITDTELLGAQLCMAQRKCTGKSQLFCIRRSGHIK